MLKKVFIISSLAASFLLTGCAQKTCTSGFETTPYNVNKSDVHTSIEEASRLVTMQLFESYSKLCAEKHAPVAFSTLVNLHDMTETSNFGRIFSELSMTHFAKHKVKVFDFRTKDAISISKEGEFLLSRDISKIKKSVEASYIYAGSYSVSEGSVIVNARLIDLQTAEVVAAASATITDPEVIALVCQNGLCNNLKKIETLKTTSVTPPSCIKIVPEDCKDPIQCKRN